MGDDIKWTNSQMVMYNTVLSLIPYGLSGKKDAIINPNEPAVPITIKPQVQQSNALMVLGITQFEAIHNRLSELDHQIRIIRTMYEAVDSKLEKLQEDVRQLPTQIKRLEAPQPVAVPQQDPRIAEIIDQLRSIKDSVSARPMDVDKASSSSAGLAKTIAQDVKLLLTEQGFIQARDKEMANDLRRIQDQHQSLMNEIQLVRAKIITENSKVMTAIGSTTGKNVGTSTIPMNPHFSDDFVIYYPNE